MLCHLYMASSSRWFLTFSSTCEEKKIGIFRLKFFYLNHTLNEIASVANASHKGMSCQRFHCAQLTGLCTRKRSVHSVSLQGGASVLQTLAPDEMQSRSHPQKYSFAACIVPTARERSPRDFFGRPDPRRLFGMRPL